MQQVWAKVELLNFECFWGKQKQTKRGSLICCTSSKKNINKAQTRTVCKCVWDILGLTKT